jgi:hypothetical protein
MSHLHPLLASSRLLTVLHDNLADEQKSSSLYNEVSLYWKKYADFNQIDIENSISIYTRFITNYNKHCKQFIKTGKYPTEISPDHAIASSDLSREEYDIVLLFSVLFSPHRFRIMQLIKEQSVTGKALFIGLGPGLEMSLTATNYEEIQAYDLTVNKFLFSEFPAVALKNELYTGQQTNYFDAIYLIELLEHLSDPYLLLVTCRDSVKKGGKIFLTTATDLPQFDHLYNFPKDHMEFESKIKSMGFIIIYKEQIEHKYLTMDLKPCNYFYCLEKA